MPKHNVSDSELEADVWHIMVTGELPKGTLRAAASSIEMSKRVQAIMRLVHKEREAAEQSGFQKGIRHKHYWFKDTPDSFCEGCGLPREEYETTRPTAKE